MAKETLLPEVENIVRNTIRSMETAQGQFIKELMEMIEISSPSDDVAGLNRMAENIMYKLTEVGMKARTIQHPLGNAVLGEINGNNTRVPTICLLAHHDTVYSDGVTAPITRIEGDKFYGAGTMDMKGGVLQAVYVLKSLLLQGYSNFNKIIFLSVPDEEVSKRNHIELLERVLKEKPFVFVLEGTESLGNIIVARKGCKDYKLKVRGIAAHSGVNPEKGRSAILEIAHQIMQFCSLNNWITGVTINPAPIRGGTHPNIVADFAEVTFELRFLRNEDAFATVERWNEIIKNPFLSNVTIRLTAEQSFLPPMKKTEDSLLTAQRYRLITDMLSLPFYAETRGGSSDGGIASELGCSVLDGLGSVGKDLHSANEHILISSIAKKTALLAGLLVFLTSKNTII